MKMKLKILILSALLIFGVQSISNPLNAGAGAPKDVHFQQLCSDVGEDDACKLHKVTDPCVIKGEGEEDDGYGMCVAIPNSDRICRCLTPKISLSDSDADSDSHLYYSEDSNF